MIDTPKVKHSFIFMLRNEVSRGDVRRELLSCVMLEMVAKLGYCIMYICKKEP